jgi:hypothetical protein
MLTARIAKIFIAFICLSALSACAASRSEVAIPSQSSSQQETGMAVVILPPVDARQFEASPKVPFAPSLKEPAQITDTQITARAVGRKRNGYGMAMGDVLLTSPQTASSLVGDAVKAGLRDSGYRIVEANDPAYATAPKISVRMNEFWTWISPGFGSISLDNITNLTLEGSLPALSVPATIEVREHKGYIAITESAWAPFIDSALAKVREKVRLIMNPKITELRSVAR